ncbi:amidase [Aspergillus tanneri]|uniref:Amidase domain-containing protein n=1 Tax=Aspergillus tanneri TaxID=1220188 RepID=A0A5M9MAR9_9EURO|nr:uncharacterized protein ATNIH1004_010963 [Aspergillus tanneri]KAA8642023.1 hypothetical protein ATNIH1004_010963 [Aspergillus tanneri]
MEPARLLQLSATEIHELIRTGNTTVEEYALTLIQRCDQRQPEVHAWVHYNKEGIITQARALDALPTNKRGPLHGVAVGIKDIFLTKGMQYMPTRYGSAIHENDDNAPADSAAVAILRAAGALILGKTATTEFAATGVGTSCTNPHNPRHSPGGSSSGSAAAVADFQVPISMGSQTGGSIIRPGAYNGIYAFKPTWGLISTEGMGRFSTTCDTIGFFANTVHDLYLLAKVFRLDFDTVPNPHPFQIKQARIAFVTTHVWDHAGPGTHAAWQKARSLLSATGAVLEDVDLPEPFARCCDWQKVVIAGEGRTAFLSIENSVDNNWTEYVDSVNKLHPTLANFVDNPNPPTRKELVQAYDSISELRQRWDRVACQYDAIITPSVTDEAPEGLGSTGSSSPLFEFVNLKT